MISIEQLASNFNLLLKYFCGYWEATKTFLLDIFNNKIIPNKKFPEYSTVHSKLVYSGQYNLSLVRKICTSNNLPKSANVPLT